MQKRRKTTAAPETAASQAVERLKPERVQEGLAIRPMRLTPLEGGQRSSLVGWKVSADGRTIARERRFQSPEEAAAYAAFALVLAAGRGLPLTLAFSADPLALRISSRAGGAGNRALRELAAALG